MTCRRLILILSLLLSSAAAEAQFYDAGNDPAGTRYSQIRTSDFRIIYPRGNDSLARRYAISLQYQKGRVGNSIGVGPADRCHSRMPVILRSYTGLSNGMVMWAPRRMELYTLPDPYSPEPMDWVENLTIHESRHACQMQIGHRGIFKPFHWISGEISDVAWWNFYPGIAFSEGDAVAAETGLSATGRGRSADFLEYVRVCFDEGDMRGWYRWRYGSVRKFTPDHYRAGYMLVAGERYSRDDTLFVKRYFDNIHDRSLPLPTANLKYTLREASGMKFDKAFADMSASFRKVWEDNDSLRAPFMDGKQLTTAGRRFTDFRGACTDGQSIYAIETGMERSPRLVRIDSKGQISPLGYFSSMTSDLSIGGGRLWWSEYRPDLRWEMAGRSAIYWMDTASRNRGVLLDGGRYFNPSISPSGEYLLVTEYPTDGSSQLLTVDARSGNVLQRLKAPDGMQIVESAWLGDRIFVSAVTSGGMGIFEASDCFREVLKATPAKIKQLRVHDGKLMFVSDRTGAGELYSFDGKELLKWSSTRHGAEEFCFNEAGDSLRYAVLTPQARVFKEKAVGEMPVSVADWDYIWRNPIAEKLSEQERSLDTLTVRMEDIQLSEAEKYRKALHLLRVHSWLPLYFEYNSLDDLSLDLIEQNASPGATVYFQNDLATMSGYAGISLKKSAENKTIYGAHLKMIYSGWYPVIETTLDIGEGNSISYSGYTLNDRLSITGQSSNRKAWKASALVYLPLNRSSGGWSRGVVPQLRYSLSNNVLDGDIAHFRRYEISDIVESVPVFAGHESGEPVMLNNLTASIRAYSMLSVAKAGVYPRWGIGVETGIGSRPGMRRIYSPAAYAYMYVYAPGIIPQHGLRLSALTQVMADPDHSYLAEQRCSMAPRGYAGSAMLGRYLAENYPVQNKFTADYMMGVLPVDWAVWNLAYIKNFHLGLHCDCTLLGQDDALMSSGVSLAANMSGILSIPFDSKLGVSWSRNSGSAYQKITGAVGGTGRNYVGMIFSISY